MGWIRTIYQIKLQCGQWREINNMHLVNIDDIIPGMQLGEPVRGARGQVLLTRGATLTPAYVNTLRTLGVPAVLIDDPDTADVDVPYPISGETRARVLKDLTRAFDELSDATAEVRKSSSPKTDLQALVRAANNAATADSLYTVAKNADVLLDELGNLETLVVPNSIKTPDLYIFQHSIDVTVMALVLAKRARWDRARAKAFGVGCLLHDLGKVLVETALLHRAGPLTPEQFEQLKAHTVIGYEMIRAIAPRLGSLSPQVAYQHHEREDGSGYPRGLRGNDRLGQGGSGTIHDFGALAAVADVYDAMVSHRPYRRALPPDQVVETITAYGGSHLNAEAVRIFRSVVTPFPICSPVVLSSGPHAGYRGVVIKVPPRALTRPVVRVLYNDRGERIEAFEVALETEGDLQLSCVYTAGPSAHSVGSAPIQPKPAKPNYAIPEAVLRVLKAG
jgi:HD-GYP domain-containing protein (c-di-GMP phosphodiesterase class II)